jgi:signal transduction histidine kinase
VFNRTEQCAFQGVKVRTAFDTSHDTLVVDGIQIRQLIENLIENALEAMPEGGELTISTSHVREHIFKAGALEYTSDALEISVEDTGSGIEKDDLQQIFQPFYTKKSKGTGLGLALVQKIVEMHHGEAHVSSTIGVGSRFVIRLPMDQTIRKQGSKEKKRDLV